jgi:hypothetical protein
VNRPALTGSFGSKKCPVRPTPLTPARARKVPDAAGALLSLVKPVSTTRRVGQGRRSAGMQAECVQGSEDLRQLHIGTMPESLPTLKVDKYRLGIVTTAVPFPRGQEWIRGTPKGPWPPWPAGNTWKALLLSNAGIEYWLAVGSEAAGTL